MRAIRNQYVDLARIDVPRTKTQLKESQMKCFLFHAFTRFLNNHYAWHAEPYWRSIVLMQVCLSIAESIAFGTGKSPGKNKDKTLMSKTCISNIHFYSAAIWCRISELN